MAEVNILPAEKKGFNNHIGGSRCKENHSAKMARHEANERRVRQFCHRNRFRPRRRPRSLPFRIEDENEDENEDDFSQTQKFCTTETYKTVHWQALTKYEFDQPPSLRAMEAGALPSIAAPSRDGGSLVTSLHPIMAPPAPPASFLALS